MIHAALTSSVLILVILLCSRIFRKWVSSKLLYGLWLLVALRLIIPVQIGCLPLRQQGASLSVTELLSELSQTPVSGNFVQAYAPEEESLSELQSTTQTATTLTLGELARIIWLSGTVAMGIWFLGVNARNKRQLLRRSTSLGRKESPIPVMVSPDATVPCLVGVFRPKIFLPPESAAESRLRYVIAHEVSHYKQKDHIWSLARCVCLCLYWFHPLVWVAALCSRRDCELACDEGALKLLGEEERLAYGAVLIATAAQSSRRTSPIYTVTNMADTKTQLKERVEHIVKKPKTFVAAAVCMLLVCITCAGCAFMGSKPESAEPSQLQIPETTSPTVPTEDPYTTQTDHIICTDIGGVQTTHFFNESYPASCAQAVVVILQNHDAVYSPDYQPGSGKNPHYLGNDGNIYYITGRNAIVQCSEDGQAVVVYTGEEMLHPIVCDGESFFFTEGHAVMVLDCQSGEARPLQP